MSKYARFFTPRVIILDQKPLSEDELAGAFAVAVDDVKMRALLQIIGDLEREANNAAQESVASPGISASHNGGAEALGFLRERILQLQEKGFGKINSQAA